MAYKYKKDKQKYLKKWRKNNPEKVKASARKSNLKRITKIYGITVDQYNILLESQNNVCAICKHPEDNVSRRLSVDHDHTTGKVRSLLCSKCNAALGMVRENKETLLNMIKYIN